jgi:hypothetical protein
MLDTRSLESDDLAVTLPHAPSPRSGRLLAIALLRALARRPMLHFVVLGAIVFGIARRPADDRTIHVDARRLAALSTEGAKRSGHAPTEEEKQRVVASAIEDELLVREARRLGLDENDEIVRQRLIQKMLFFLEDLGGASRTPDEPALRAFFAANRDRYHSPAHLRFVQVYATSQARARELVSPVAEFERTSADAAALPPVGDPLPVARSFDGSAPDAAAVYGASFVAALTSLPAGRWSEPIPSGVGWHLVKLLERRDERPASFEDVRGRVPLDYLIDRRERAVHDHLSAALARYAVDVDGAPVRSLGRTGRRGVHNQSSAED